MIVIVCEGVCVCVCAVPLVSRPKVAAATPKGRMCMRCHHSFFWRGGGSDNRTFGQDRVSLADRFGRERSGKKSPNLYL